MALYLLHRKHSGARNELGLHAVLVNATDANAAIALVESRAPWGSANGDIVSDPALWLKKGIKDWAVYDVSTLASGNLLWFQGEAVSLHGIDRGGSRVWY